MIPVYVQLLFDKTGSAFSEKMYGHCSGSEIVKHCTFEGDTFKTQQNASYC